MEDFVAPSSNTALAISSNHTLSAERNLPLPIPAEDEILVRVLYSGINPADIKHKVLGIVDTHLGYDFCGIVHRAAQLDDVFAVGDLVAGTTPTGCGRPKRYGAHQDYLACPTSMAFKVPSNLSPSHAACLSVTTLTAADILFNLCGFDINLLDSPSVSPAPAGQTSAILIWGASTSVGNACVQFARALGIPNVITTASKSRHSLLQSLGATHCFDYKDSSTPSQIKRMADTESFQITHAIDAVGTTGIFSNSATLVRACCSDESTTLISTVVRPFDKAFKMPLATKNSTVELRLQILPFLKAVDIFGSYMPTFGQTIDADPEAHAKSWQGLLWAVENYGGRFQLPQVQEIDNQESAERVLDEVDRIARGAGSFGKYVVKHPLS